MNLVDLQNAIRQDDIFTSPHALSEAIADGLALDEVWSSLLLPAAEVIEDYPSDPRGPSCLMLSAVRGRPIHTVIAYPSKRYAAQRQVSAIAFMVTVYCPDTRPHEWARDYRTRLHQP